MFILVSGEGYSLWLTWDERRYCTTTKVLTHAEGKFTRDLGIIDNLLRPGRYQATGFLEANSGGDRG